MASHFYKLLKHRAGFMVKSPLQLNWCVVNSVNSNSTQWTSADEKSMMASIATHTHTGGQRVTNACALY